MTLSVGVGDVRDRLFVCLFVCSITKKKWSKSVQTWCREWSWDVLEVTWFWDWKVKRQGYRVNNIIHDDTSFQTTIALYSHSLGGYTDKSNTAWVRILWVHSSCFCGSHRNFSVAQICGLSSAICTDVMRSLRSLVHLKLSQSHT